MIIESKAVIKHDEKCYSTPMKLTLDFDEISKQVYGGWDNKQGIEEVIILMPQGCMVYGIPVKWQTEEE